MPKMTHWNSPDTIDAAPEKVAVYSGQGWVPADEKKAAKAVAAVTREDVAPAPEETAPVKKAAAKKTTKKAATKKAAK